MTPGIVRTLKVLARQYADGAPVTVEVVNDRTNRRRSFPLGISHPREFEPGTYTVRAIINPGQKDAATVFEDSFSVEPPEGEELPEEPPEMQAPPAGDDERFITRLQTLHSLQLAQMQQFYAQMAANQSGYVQAMQRLETESRERTDRVWSEALGMMREQLDTLRDELEAARDAAAPAEPEPAAPSGVAAGAALLETLAKMTAANGKAPRTPPPLAQQGGGHGEAVDARA